MSLKLNVKMKKRIRKAVAGVCLVSAVLVAAIPADYSGVAQAEDKMEIMDYNYDSNLSRNGIFTNNNDTAAPSMTRPEDDSRMRKSYCIRKIESEYVLVYEYDYFTQRTSKGDVGVITAYNNFGATSRVDLSAYIATGFKIVEPEDYNNFVSANIINNQSFNFSLNGTLNDTNATLAKSYFPNKYREFEKNYNDAVARYIEQEQEKGNIVTDSEARQKTLLQLGGTEVKVTGSDMPEENRRMYYCDNNGNFPTGLFTLEEVTNTAQGEEYYSDDKPTSADIPDVGSLYVYKLVNNGPSAYKTDENGFLITARQFITAIGEKAFYNTKGVDEIIVGDGINYIGDSAFENSFIKTVAFNSVFYIGNSVFKNNPNLSSITLAGATTVIGKEAFYGCPKLTEIVFNNELKEIGFGAFANCQLLSLADFSACTKVNIGEYAFFDCPSLKDVIFASSPSETSIGKAAFALSTKGPSSSMTVFDFPEIITKYTSAADYTTYSNILHDKDNAPYNSPMGDYILAGRTNLKTVTMPDQYGMSSQDIKVPINTFKGCENLETVIFPKDARMVSYHEDLFQDVENEKFYVRGPENTSQSSSKPAMPRTSTWSASTNAAKYVPYVYTDRYGIEHYEVGNGIYRYELQINTTENGEEDGTATLISCQFIDTAQTIDEMIVPGIVASYRVTALGDGCYSTDSLTSPAVKDYIVKLVVEDDSIEEIGQSVFSNCAKLESVQLGNSVKTIGTNAFSNNKLLEKVTIGGGIETVGEKAFANCPKLTDVIWEKPIYNNTQVVIADDSFATGGKMLYFEGDIALGYGPFDYAMEDATVGKSHYIDNISGTRICYRSEGPNYYYVIRDEAAGENLLIDYPHYADLPKDVRERYERRTEVVSENGTVVTLDEPLKPSALDIQLVEQTRQLVLPEAVTSIDVKSFYLSDSANNVNQGSWIYITALNEQDVSGGMKIPRQDLYNNDDLAVSGIPLKDTFEESGGYHSGLFSGYYVDQIPLSADGIDTTKFPLQTKGNDWIISIEMPGVTSIPEYAFDSCESLQSIIISEACEEIAPTSFRNCNALRTVTATGDYTFDNYILYKTLEDGTYQITTCLPGRGVINQSITDRFVNAANDPKLADTSELEVGAFDGCAGIVGVDLSDTSIIKVPQNTFNNCKMLSEVTLPETPDMIIEGDAFRGNGPTLKVTIPAVLSIADSAFDPVNTVTNIYTKPECRFITTTYQKKDANGNTVNSKTNIYVHFIDSEFTVSFLNDDNTPYEERTVKSGSATYLPDVNPTPKKEEHSGWVFDSWKYYYTDWTEYDQPGNPLQSVTTDLYAVAQFVPDPDMPYFTITFRYDDYSVFETKQVAEGNNGLLPSTNPQPKLPEHQGWNFSHWNYYDSTLGLENVTEDRNAIAVFTAASVSGNGPGNNPGGGDGSSNNPSGGDGSGNNPSGSSGNNNNGSTSNNSASNNAANNNGKYNVIVENGAGGGYYAPGSVVTITAYAAPSGKVFDRWTTSNTDIGFSNAFGASTTFIMPTHEVKVTATYKIPSASSNRVSGNSTTNSTNNKNNNSNNTSSGGGTRNPSGGGTDVTVTTTAIDNNNKNLASATVSGSTDNFVVKITDSAAASAAVEQALRAQYGDLSNIRFVGFDISLYDETGTRKIENTAGLAVNITIPIPDDLVPYAGNNMAAGVVNGVLDPMAVKFTTIDGVPCMQFTATHFSPYAIYVNTNNLVSGVTDTTPKTGDIHPKWFLAIGLACISGVLFTWKDKRKVPV